MTSDANPPAALRLTLNEASARLHDLDRAGHALRHAIMELEVALRFGDREAEARYRREINVALADFGPTCETAEQSLDRMWTLFKLKPTPAPAGGNRE